MIEFNNEHNFNISTIDADHKEFVDIISKATIAEKYDSNPEKINEVLNEMIDYAWNHFQTDETHMYKFKYSDYNQHKEEHLGFVKKTLFYRNRLARGDHQISNEILEYLKQWLTKHILGTDKKYRECIIKNSFK